MLCCVVTDKTVFGCFGSRTLSVSHKNTLWKRSALVRKQTKVDFCYRSILYCSDRLTAAEEGAEASHSTISGSFKVKRIGTVAVHSTIDSERNCEIRRTCSNDDHVAGTTVSLESRKSTGRWLRLQSEKQFRQRCLMRIHDQMNDKVWSTSESSGDTQRSKETL